MLAVGAGAVFAFLSGQPDVVLPIVAAAEIAYLQIAIDKTAGEEEAEAWGWLLQRVDALKLHRLFELVPDEDPHPEREQARIVAGLAAVGLVTPEGGVLEDPWAAAPEDIYTLTVSPRNAPDTPEDIEVEFQAGDPVAVNGTSTLTFTLQNENDIQLTGVTFSDALPSGVEVANPPAASTTCGGSPTWSPGPAAPRPRRHRANCTRHARPLPGRPGPCC